MLHLLQSESQILEESYIKSLRELVPKEAYREFWC